VVGVGNFLRTRSLSTQFVGTGFAVLNRGYVITNSYAFASPLGAGKKEKTVVALDFRTRRTAAA
jgi:hypothetical protein